MPVTWFSILFYLTVHFCIFSPNIWCHDCLEFNRSLYHYFYLKVCFRTPSSKNSRSTQNRFYLLSLTLEFCNHVCLCNFKEILTASDSYFFFLCMLVLGFSLFHMVLGFLHMEHNCSSFPLSHTSNSMVLCFQNTKRYYRV